jgi:hypothetical protein
MFVLADNVKIEPTKGPLSAPTQELIKNEAYTLDTVPDHLNVFWVDAKKAFPALEALLKPIFGGKDRISMKDLKEKVAAMPEKETDKWLSEIGFTWHNHGEGGQRQLGREKQIAIQLNFGREIVLKIDKSPVARKFFHMMSKNQMGGGVHPTHSQTIAWARVYPMEGHENKIWIIEEIQSDIFGHSTKTADIGPQTNAFKTLENMAPAERAELDKFFHENFLDWDKKLLATVISLARQRGVKNVYMFDEDIKSQATNSHSLLNRIYKVTPRDLGFKRETLKVGDKELSAWHRVVASFSQRVSAKLLE